MRRDQWGNKEGRGGEGEKEIERRGNCEKQRSDE